MRWFILCLFLAGCGYRWEPEFPLEKGRPTISVPYVVGDADGSLTAEIIRALTISGICKVEQWGARYSLKVTIAGAEGQTIGYRRDRQQISGESKKNLVASERRKTMSVKVALLESDSGKLVIGPIPIDAYVDFDYVDGDSIQDLVF